MEETTRDDVTAYDDPAATRLDFDALVPRFSAAMSRLDAVAGQGLDRRLRELVRLHASTINGCAYCVDMHSKDARAAGETEQRLYSLGAWREAPWFTPAERAALALTEAVTVLHEEHVPRAVFDEAARHYEPEALAQLISLLVTINAWNRIGVATRCWEPGSYESEG
jgi:AhpD family alkylhydroperoxidase